MGNADTKNIHVVCLGNISRSPPAQYLLQSHLKKAQENQEEAQKVNYSVSSSGLSGGYYTEMESYSEAYLDAKNIDYADFTSQKTTREILAQQNLILVMEDYMRRRIIGEFFGYEVPPQIKILTFREAAGKKGNISDPYGWSRKDYDRIMEEIDELSQIIASKILSGEL